LLALEAPVRVEGALEPDLLVLAPHTDVHPLLAELPGAARTGVDPAVDGADLGERRAGLVVDLQDLAVDPGRDLARRPPRGGGVRADAAPEGALARAGAVRVHREPRAVGHALVLAPDQADRLRALLLQAVGAGE